MIFDDINVLCEGMIKQESIDLDLLRIVGQPAIGKMNGFQFIYDLLCPITFKYSKLVEIQTYYPPNMAITQSREYINPEERATMVYNYEHRKHTTKHDN